MPEFGRHQTWGTILGLSLSASTSVIVPAHNAGPAVGRLNSSVLLITLSVVIFLIGLVSEQISTLRFGGRFEDTGRPEEPRA